MHERITDRYRGGIVGGRGQKFAFQNWATDDRLPRANGEKAQCAFLKFYAARRKARSSA